MTAAHQPFEKFRKSAVFKGRQILSHLLKFWRIEVNLIITKKIDKAILEVFGHYKVSDLSWLVMEDFL